MQAGRQAGRQDEPNSEREKKRKNATRGDFDLHSTKCWSSSPGCFGD